MLGRTGLVALVSVVVLAGGGLAGAQTAAVCPLATPALPQGEGVRQHVVVGQPQPCPLGPDRAAFSVTTDFGDGTTVDTPFAAEDAAWFVGGIHTYRRAGTYALTGTITNRATGASTVLRRTIRVPNVPLVRRSTPRPLFSTARSLERVVARYRDTNPLAVAGDHRASVSWGDGTRTAGSVTKSRNGDFVVRARHRYRSATGRAISVTITDDRAGRLVTRLAPRF